MNFFSKFFEKLPKEKIINGLIFLLSALFLTLLLSSKYYIFQSIMENGLSKRDIVATKKIEVVDVDKTEKRKRDLAKKVDPILTPLQNDYILNNYRNLISSIKNFREKDLSKKERNEEIIKFTDIADSDREKQALVYLVNTSDYNFNMIAHEGEQTLKEMLSMSISESELDHIDRIISRKINPSLTAKQTQAVLVLIKQTIIPNLIEDELATEIARKNAANSVKPIVVTFEPGSKIVYEGEAISPLKKDALKKAGYNVTELNLLGLTGLFAIVCVCMFCFLFYLTHFDSKYATPRYSLLTLLLASLMIGFAISLPFNVPVYLLPFPAFAMLIAIFTNQKVSLLTSTLLIILMSVSFQYTPEATFAFIIESLISIFAVGKLNYSRRMDLIKMGFEISFIEVYAISAIYILHNNFSTEAFLLDVTMGVVSCLISGIIVLGIIPILESMFKIITPYGLAELADHNQELLKRLQFEAPGTYHHSLMVSNLVEAAAEAVGANPILAMVGSFYHDIGKLKRPLFFVENQSYFSIENPHEKLNPKLSKMVITAHPKDGLELAKEYGLPQEIWPFIIQHHGDSIASYFYNQAKQQEGAENVTESQFRYTCPKPNTKETAILMLADAVESAVRSLSNPTQEEVEKLIDKIIQDRLMDGQLSESPLTQKDLKVIAATFLRILRGMQHHRIKYHDNVIEELNTKTQTQQTQKTKPAQSITISQNKEAKNND